MKANRAPQPGEPVMTVVRFQQAVNRLQVMRNMKDVPDRLLARMTRRFKAWNLQDGTYNYRFFDLGAE